MKVGDLVRCQTVSPYFRGIRGLVIDVDAEEVHLCLFNTEKFSNLPTGSKFWFTHNEVEVISESR